MLTPTINDSQRLQLAPLKMPPRLLLGPGPSNVHPAVLHNERAHSRAPRPSISGSHGRDSDVAALCLADR